MKKLIFIFLLFSSVCQAQFGWGGLSSSQWVSFSDSQGSGIYVKQPVPSTSQLMDKAAVLYYYDVNPSFLTSLADNQWVTKAQIDPYNTSNTINWYYTGDAGLYTHGEFTILVNGVQVVNTIYTASGSFVVNNNDYVEVRVTTSNGGGGWDEGIMEIKGDNGLYYYLDANSAGYTQIQAFYVSLYYHTITITGITQIPVTPIPIYYNVEYSTVRYRNDCPSGYTGGAYTTTIGANNFISTISQVDADLQAVNSANAIAQVRANIYGSCTLNSSSGIIQWSFGTNIVGSTVLFTITKNGTTVVNPTSSASGTISVSNGDVIIATVETTFQGTTGYNERLAVVGNGLGYTVYSAGDLLLTKTFTYNTSNGIITIDASKFRL